MDAEGENQNVVSVISHGDGQLVVNLLQAIQSFCNHSTLRVIVTVSIPEQLSLAPKRHGANHNAVFKLMQGNAFSVLNPGIRLTADLFVVLTERLDALKAGIVAPLILGPEGTIEDSVWRMPTPLRIVKRVCEFPKVLDYEIGTVPIAPDWVAGMFPMFSNRAFAEFGGFDERYYMYCQDANLCAQLSEIGYGVWLILR